MPGFGDGDPQLDLGQAWPDRLQGLGKPGVEDHDLSVSIVEQVDEFLAAITIVGVDRGKARLEGRKVDLEVLGPVEEVGGDLGLGAHPSRRQKRRQGVCPCVEPPPGDDPITLDQGGTVRGLAGDGLPDFGDPPVGHLVLPLSAFRYSAARTPRKSTRPPVIQRGVTRSG